MSSTFRGCNFAAMPHVTLHMLSSEKHEGSVRFRIFIKGEGVQAWLVSGRGSGGEADFEREM